MLTRYVIVSINTAELNKWKEIIKCVLYKAGFISFTTQNLAHITCTTFRTQLLCYTKVNYNVVYSSEFIVTRSEK